MRGVARAHQLFGSGGQLGALNKYQATAAQGLVAAAGAGGITISLWRFWWHFVTLFGILCAYFRWLPALMQSTRSLNGKCPDPAHLLLVPITYRFMTDDSLI